VRTHPDIDKMIAEKLEEPLDIKAYSRKNHSELEDN
jgi:hypothetical protein